jgi:hypothetical protein
MIYNDSQLFAITRSQYSTRNDEVQKISQEAVTMAQKIERLRSLGYTTEVAQEPAQKISQDVKPLSLRGEDSEVVKDGITYFVKESYVWTRSFNTKTICWTIAEDKTISGENLAPGIVSASTLKELKLKLAQEGFAKK